MGSSRPWLRGLIVLGLSYALPAMSAHAAVADRPPVFTAAMVAPVATPHARVFFTGGLEDDGALASLRMVVSGPRGSGIVAFDEALSGKGKWLGSYAFDPASRSYAGAPGSYVVVLEARDAAGHLASHTFGIAVVPAPSTGADAGAACNDPASNARYQAFTNLYQPLLDLEINALAEKQEKTNRPQAMIDTSVELAGNVLSFQKAVGQKSANEALTTWIGSETQLVESAGVFPRGASRRVMGELVDGLGTGVSSVGNAQLVGTYAAVKMGAFVNDMVATVSTDSIASRIGAFTAARTVLGHYYKRCGEGNRDAVLQDLGLTADERRACATGEWLQCGMHTVAAKVNARNLGFILDERLAWERVSSVLQGVHRFAPQPGPLAASPPPSPASCGAGCTGAAPPPLSPRVAVSPESAARARDALTESGSGFSPNSRAICHAKNQWKDTSFTLPVNAQGSFSNTFRPPSGAGIGAYDFWCVDGATGDSSNHAAFRIKPWSLRGDQ